MQRTRISVLIGAWSVSVAVNCNSSPIGRWLIRARWAFSSSSQDRSILGHTRVHIEALKFIFHLCVLIGRGSISGKTFMYVGGNNTAHSTASHSQWGVHACALRSWANETNTQLAFVCLLVVFAEGCMHFVRPSCLCKPYKYPGTV